SAASGVSREAADVASPLQRRVRPHLLRARLPAWNRVLELRGALTLAAAERDARISGANSTEELMKACELRQEREPPATIREYEEAELVEDGADFADFGEMKGPG